MFSKTAVRGADASPLFKQLAQLTDTAPKWNFYKYLISRDGKQVKSYNNTTDPLYILPDAPNNTIVARYNRGTGFYSSAPSVAQYLNLVGQQTTTTLSPAGSLGTQTYGRTNSFTVDITGLPLLSSPNQPLPGSQVQLVANGTTVEAAPAPA